MRFALICFSHVALGLAGWKIARESRVAASPELAENVRFHSQRPHPGKSPGEALVRSIEVRLENAKLAAAQLAAGPSVRDRILDALSGSRLPEDPAASIRTMLSDDGEVASIRAGALFVLWAKSDPAAALQFAGNRDDFRRMSCDDEALELVGESIPSELALAMPGNSVRDSVYDGFARQLIAKRSVEELTSLIAGSEDDLKRQLCHFIGNQWPAERLDDFGRLATALGNTEMLDWIDDKLPPEEMSRWMIRFVVENPDPEFVRKIREGTSYFVMMLRRQEIPLEVRMHEISKRLGFGIQAAEGAPNDAMRRLVENDVSDFFHGDGPDYLYEFHHGTIEASEILAKLTQRYPAYADAGLLPAFLYRHLAWEDPDRAASLIAGLPDEERARVMTDGFYARTSLESLGRFLRSFPASDDEAVLQFRRKIWDFRTTDHGLNHYGMAYLSWIESLPDPRDRKMAFEAITDRIKGSMDWKADEIRRIVGDTPSGVNPENHHGQR